jgi:Zn-dependent protease
VPDLSDRIPQAITSYVVLLFSLSFHEAAHGWMAWRMGDPTAMNLGRVSLNPLVHIDPIGTVLMPLLMFFSGGLPFLAWAKPTPYQPANIRRDRSVAQGHILIASAGPVSNAILALAFTLLLVIAVRSGVAASLGEPGLMILSTGVQLNVALALFNMLPVPPLDGSKVASWGLPRPLGEAYDRVMEPYGFLILLALVMTGVVGWILEPIMGFVITLLLQLVR